jgi:hypothetical protein
MVEAFQLAIVFGAVAAAILVPFLVVPEIMERRGYAPHRGLVRLLVWLTFLAIVFVPAAATGYLFTVTNPADWLLGAAFLAVAVLYDYYRLNPDKLPWHRRLR